MEASGNDTAPIRSKAFAIVDPVSGILETRKGLVLHCAYVIVQRATKVHVVSGIQIVIDTRNVDVSVSLERRIEAV